MIDPDKINNVAPKKVAQASMALIDRMQDFESHTQVLAAAMVFLTLTEHHRAKAQDVFTITKNIMHERDRMRPEFAAVLDYVKHEIKN